MASTHVARCTRLPDHSPPPPGQGPPSLTNPSIPATRPTAWSKGSTPHPPSAAPPPAAACDPGQGQPIYNTMHLILPPFQPYPLFSPPFNPTHPPPRCLQLPPVARRGEVGADVALHHARRLLLAQGLQAGQVRGRETQLPQQQLVVPATRVPGVREGRVGQRAGVLARLPSHRHTAAPAHSSPPRCTPYHPLVHQPDVLWWLRCMRQCCS